jgi:hypothetical protein
MWYVRACAQHSSPCCAQRAHVPPFRYMWPAFDLYLPCMAHVMPSVDTWIFSRLKKISRYSYSALDSAPRCERRSPWLATNIEKVVAVVTQSIEHTVVDPIGSPVAVDKVAKVADCVRRALRASLASDHGKPQVAPPMCHFSFVAAPVPAHVPLHTTADHQSAVPPPCSRNSMVAGVFMGVLVQVAVGC